MKTRSASPSGKVKRSFSSHSLIFISLLSFRLLNALTVQTFFQPDEYFQALEPAWDKVFGGAWVTWEWNNQLRSFAHPLIFAALYKAVDFISEVFGLRDVMRAEVLAVAPKVLQACFSALGDYYTAKLAGKLFGGVVGWTSLWLSIGSAFHYFCSTRTFSNSLETSITIITLYYWPKTWTRLIVTEKENVRKVKMEINRGDLRLSLLLAAFACILRPTNALIWVTLASFALYNGGKRERLLLVREAIMVGVSAIALNAIIDHRYYDKWTFPPLKFLEFNLVQSLSVFYGRNPWHYYLSQGLPLLLTTFLPLALLSLYKFLFRPYPTINKTESTAGFELSVTIAFVIGIYSLISHKEVRFIYPLLPILHVLSAATLEELKWSKKTKKVVLLGMVLLNMPIAWYATQVHQRGVMDVADWLRGTGAEENGWESVGFLMPCHSTPWKSTVTGNGKMWALGCEPPIGLSDEEKLVYLDEADQFYADPEAFLSHSFPPPPTLKKKEEDVDEIGPTGETRLYWPDRLIFFEASEQTINNYLGPDTAYRECKRFFNSHVHDDSRRKGDVVVLCRENREG
ncbi:glycosylphosphatidylinositol anchor biosynthesis [Rhizina undulata]